MSIPMSDRSKSIARDMILKHERFVEQHEQDCIWELSLILGIEDEEAQELWEDSK